MAKAFNLNLPIDASGLDGFDAIFGFHWCFEKWPFSWKIIPEIYRVVLSLYLSGDALNNQCILSLYRY